MNGSLLTSPPVAIDYWNLRECSKICNFFLTHMHSDHTQGLNSNWCKTIFCSPITKKLLIHMYKISERYIRELKLNTPHSILIDPDSHETMEVTLIDANHCPGSVMIHFEGSFGQILHTGDFRYSEILQCQLEMSIPHLKVDHLYLDNTYWCPGSNFPTREEATDEVIEIIKDYPGHKILIALYRIGKEYLLEAICKRLNEKIYVPQRRLDILKIAECSGTYVTNFFEADIRVVERWNVSREFNESNKFHPTIAIIPSAFCGDQNLNDTRIFRIPLSDHSSYDELQAFIKFAQPKCITCIAKNAPSKNVVVSSPRSQSSSSSLSSPLNSDPKINLPTSGKMLKSSKSYHFWHKKLNRNEQIKRKNSLPPCKSKFPKPALEYFNNTEETVNQEVNCPPNDELEISDINITSSSLNKLKKLLSPTRKQKSIICSMCGKRSPVDELEYNRNKDDIYDPGLCSLCDVIVSQIAEKEKYELIHHASFPSLAGDKEEDRGGGDKGCEPSTMEPQKKNGLQKRNFTFRNIAMCSVCGSKFSMSEFHFKRYKENSCSRDLCGKCHMAVSQALQSEELEEDTVITTATE